MFPGEVGDADEVASGVLVGGCLPDGGFLSQHLSRWSRARHGPFFLPPIPWFHSHRMSDICFLHGTRISYWVRDTIDLMPDRLLNYAFLLS